MIPGAGESTEGKGGAEDKCFASAPRGHPHAYKGNTRYQSPRAVRVPAPCSRAHDGAGGTAAPKPGRPETGSCHQGEEKHRGTFPFLFGTDNTHLRVSRSWWMKRQKSWGFSVLKGARDEKRIAPASTYPFPSPGRECGLHPWGGGRTDSRELGAIARGVCKTVEGGGWPLPSRRGERKGGQLVEGWKWRVAEPHTATCDHLLSSSIANTVPVLTWPKRSECGSASREQPAKGQR